MSQRKNLYRRSSGIYVVRITVPQRFRRYAGQCEIHTSTGTNQLHEAKKRSAHLLAAWYQTLLEYEEFDHRSLSESASLPSGEGMISFNKFAEVTELPVIQLIQVAIKRNLPVFWLASGQMGVYVENVSDMVEGHVISDFALKRLFDLGKKNRAVGYLQPLSPLQTLQRLMSKGFSEEERAFRVAGHNRKSGWLFDLPDMVITPQNLMLNKVQAESLRLDLLTKSIPSAVSIHRLAPAPAPITTPIAAIANEYVNRKYYSKTLSWLCEEYLQYRRKGKISEAAIGDISYYFGLMVEVMGNIKLENFDRDFLRSYEGKLRVIPANRNLMKTKHGVETLDELIIKVAESGDKLMSDEAVRKYLNGVFGAIKWAVGDGKLLKSPCDSFFPRHDKEQREQDHTDIFEGHEIWAIFSLPWFFAGTSERNAQGRFHHYRPFHYWAPLLGLLTGARVNELSQLLLLDILEEDDVFYINLVSDDESGKKLKNVNARRKIPIHSKLIELGFIEYVKALRSAGYIRLFPELKPHKTKGYGRPVSAWFNESLLARRLKLERNRTKSFHSFRHSVSTLLKEKGVSPELRAQLVGHVRGETETQVRYSKDLKPVHMVAVIEKLDFVLPEIANFNILDGLAAVSDALKIKRNS